MMKPFVFQKFAINQNQNVFRVGTDGVILGALVNVQDSSSVLEVGSGTGLISLMVAQRNPHCKITAIEINPEAVKLSLENFENAPFSERMSVVQEDFKQIQISEKFDLIISNPPYFEESQSEKDKIARQTIELNFQDLIQKSAALISEKGRFCVIIPFQSCDEFVEICKSENLKLTRKVVVYGIENSKPRRVVLEFSKTATEFSEETFIIEKSPRNYSDHYLELTKEFHIFNK